MAFMIDFQIALIFAFSIPILFIIVFGIMKITGPLYKNLQSKLDSLTVSTRENILGVRVIRAFRGERAEATAFKGKNADLSKSQIFVGKISALMNPLTYAIINIGIVLILWFGAGKVNGGILLKGSVIALVNYLSQILVELIKLANTVVLLSRSIASMGRISGVLDMESSMKFGCVKESFEQGELVRFENVSLKYSEGSEEALSDISFSINKGETIGIIGETGSGKTSIASLISRFYDATSGQVYFKGKPIEIWSKNELYSKIATVFQKVQLLSGTVRSNVCLGKENASDEEIMRALEIAQAADFVLSKPGGLDSEISAGGANLSGGQKQRLTIARAVLTRPELLILDDSSSALDYATDLKLRKALKEISKETTTVIISQRTSSIRHADKILVLDDGRLSAIGTHDELLSISPLYKEIHEINTGKGDNND
jgi:ABC-type multidrug transport system fused ATPase/permease subunit